MENTWYSFDISPGWLILAVIAAFGLALLLYSKKGVPWSKNINVFLGILRFTAIFLVLLLLLNPLFELNVSREIRPTLLFALDNSESVISRENGPDASTISDWLERTATQREDQFEISYDILSGEMGSDSIRFDGRVTNLGEMLRQIDQVYEDSYLGGVILLSDGIINEGQSPAFRNFSFPIFTIGLGDTIPPKDISIRNVRNNQVAYQGNSFPVIIQIGQKGYDNSPISVKLKEGNRTLKEREIRLDRPLVEVEFLLEANRPGLRRIAVEILQMEDESSYANNQQDIYIDVIEGKDRVLILAPAPHPDINAIRSVLTESPNYESFVFIPGLTEKRPEGNFDVIIEHEAFSSTNYGDFSSNGRLYILGDRSNLSRMSAGLNYARVDASGSQTDLVRGVYDPAFTKFKLTSDLTDRLANYPPIPAPFGKYETSGPADVLLYQKVGSIVTSRPLFLFLDDGSSKSALLFGSGIWQWKLQEAGREENSKLFNEIVLKTIQYLSIKVNKDRFVVKPRESNYQVGDRVFLDTEVYNEIYERSYGNTIGLTLTDENQKATTYEIVDGPMASTFSLGNLQAGTYEYAAQTEMGGKSFRETGSLVVRNVKLESIDLTANHNLLRQIANNSGGNFYPFEQADELLSDLENREIKNKLSTSEELFPLINSWWVIVLIVALLGTEWFLRKYLGAY